MRRIRRSRSDTLLVSYCLPIVRFANSMMSEISIGEYSSMIGGTVSANDIHM